LTFLDYNLVTGDSLVGISTLEEAATILDIDETSLALFTDSKLVFEEIQEDIERLGDFADLSAKRVQESRKTRSEIESKLEEVRARLDILSASRLSEEIEAEAASETNVNLEGLDSYSRSQRLLDSFNTLHFPTAFPEVFMGDRDGFDVIVGNPPWDKVRFEPQQFWVTRHPGLNALPKSRRDERMDELRERYPKEADEEAAEKEQRSKYQNYVSQAYKDQSYGHYDYAKLFVERADDLLHSDGHLGYVLPRQCLVLSGWKKLRHRLIDDSEVTVLQARNSGGWMFEKVHHSYMIVLITSSPSEEEVTHVWPAIEEESAFDKIGRSGAINLAREELASLTTEDRLVVPWFNQDGARDVFPMMRTRSRLSSEEGWFTGIHDAHWDFRSSGPHSELSRSEPKESYWKVFMTRHIKQFQIDESREFRRYVDPVDLEAEDQNVESNGEAKLTSAHPSVVFRHVSRNDDTRTIIATVLPEQEFVYCKGYVHAIAHSEKQSEMELLALLAYLNSFACDWWARRIVDRHVSSPVINNLPIPEWGDQEIQSVGHIASELVRRGGTTTLPGGAPIPTVDALVNVERREILARIEGLVARGFELEKEHYDTILADFSSRACPRKLASRIDEVVSSAHVESITS
jgi:hypothetical protein